MFSGGKWKVATIRGIPLYLSASWIWIAALYVWSVYAGLANGPVFVDSTQALLLSILAALLFFGSVLAHELAHAAMARGLDLPVSGITLLFWGGATETRANARGPLGEFLVAFVGPATTLALSGVFWGIHSITQGVASELLRYLGWISLIFAAVNALPGFPLDGGRMLLAAVWGITGNRRTALRAAGYVGIAVGFGLAIAAVWSFSHDTGWWLFLGYLAFIMISTGRGMDQRIAFRDQLVTGRVADAMRQPPPTIPASMSLSQALDHVLRGTRDEAFPVVEGGSVPGRVVGTVSMRSAGKIGHRDPMRPVTDALTPLNQTPVLAPTETLDDALEWLGGRDGLVLDDGALVGALAPADIERWYQRVVEGKPQTEKASTDWWSGAGVPPRPDL